MPEKIFLNDKLINTDKAAISTRDTGFLYGSGLFETMRCNQGKVFCLNDHLDRLLDSAKKLSIDINYDREYITDAIYSVLSANKLDDARVRLTITPGPVPGPVSEADEAEQTRQCTILIACARFQPYPKQYYDKGIMVVLSPYRQNPYDPVCGHKTTSCFSRMLALELAHRHRAAEALWFTTDNRLAEGCISNVFLVRDSKLLTPRAETPVLAGIARKNIFELTQQDSIELQETDLTINDLLAADEVFLTNVIMQVMPVVAVEKHTVGNGKPGPITKKLHKAFLQLLDQESKP